MRCCDGSAEMERDCRSIYCENYFRKAFPLVEKVGKVELLNFALVVSVFIILFWLAFLSFCLR